MSTGQKIEQCNSDICMNHGVCVPVNDQFECKCTPRYSGVHCEIDEGIHNLNKLLFCCHKIYFFKNSFNHAIL